jgi:hypothetical protein
MRQIKQGRGQKESSGKADEPFPVIHMYSSQIPDSNRHYISNTAEESNKTTSFGEYVPPFSHPTRRGNAGDETRTELRWKQF